MPRLDPLPPDHTPELELFFDFFLTTLGFTPNSVLTMQHNVLGAHGWAPGKHAR